MNDHFADWHRAVSIDLVGIDLGARWSGVEAVVEELDAEHVAQLVEIACCDALGARDILWLRRPFKDRESAFAMKDNDREMSMLAAAVLFEVIRGEGELSVLAAYLCDITRFLGWAAPLDDLVTTARRRLDDLAVARRTTAEAPVARPPAIWAKALKEILDPVAAAAYPSGEVFVTAVTKLATLSQSAITAAIEHTDRVAAWAGARVVVSEEETDLLWWMLSGHSSSLGVPWNELRDRTVAVAAARELAARIVVLPAPAHCDALLAQMMMVASRSKRLDSRDLGTLEVPTELRSLLADVEHQDALALAEHSLRQALALRAWEEATS